MTEPETVKCMTGESAKRRIALLNWLRFIVCAVVSIGLCGCSKSGSAAGDVPVMHSMHGWTKYENTVVEIVGIAEDRKASGAINVGDGFAVYLPRLQRWPDGVAGETVKARGVLRHKFHEVNAVHPATMVTGHYFWLEAATVKSRNGRVETGTKRLCLNPLKFGAS